MRTAVLVLMLVLLPLRGWAGGTMSVEHPPASAGLVSQTAAPCHADDATAAEPAAATDAATTGEHTCGLCDVCHNQLMTLAVHLGNKPALPHARHLQPRERFDSAPARQSLKPPKTWP